MNFTLFGYPKTGKTTLFNLLTGAKIQVKSYDQGKKEPHARTCPVPDQRMDELSKLYPEKDKIPAQIDYIDLAGVSYGEIKNESYLDYLRKADGLTHVVRNFQNIQVPHHKDQINTPEDIQSIEQEIILADLISVESRLDKLDKELQKARSSEGEKEKEILEKIKSSLEQAVPIRSLTLKPAEEKLIRNFAFLSQKPLIHMVNVDETEISLIETPEKIFASDEKKTSILAFCGKIESEILELEGEDRKEFMEEYGLKELSISRFLRASYQLMDVITFFTIGKEEVKSWTIQRNSTALQAAGKIHSDIEKGFIRAEVIPWDVLLELGSFQEARKCGSIRLEGKDYLVQDGDVVYFRFS
ncbi:MAG: redox-regulated ATPase YchF [Candidatus Aminicenantes bacterium]|nr:redox-regulated ATPase YchF [Candidatus Aminicenantes bacterium]